MARRVVDDRYLLGEVLTESQLTTVYGAVDLHLRRSVALKLLNPEAAGDPELVQRFLDDARAAASLAHPNVAATYDVGTEDGVPFAVSEQVEGRRLRDLIRDDAPLRSDRIKHLGSQLAAALDYAQRHDGVGYPLDPGEVLVTRDDGVKVLGFRTGREVKDAFVSTRYDSAGDNGRTLPENAQQNQAAGVFSIGVVLYEMATGRSPYREDQPWLSKGPSAGPPVRPSLHNPSLPASLERVIMGTMETGPDRRYRTVSDLSRALQIQDAQSSEDTLVRPAIESERTRIAPTVYPQTYRSAPSAAAVMISTLILAAVIFGAIAAGTVFRSRVDLPNVAGFVSGPAPQQEAQQRAAQAAAADLEKAMGTVRGNTQRVNTLLNTVRDRLAAEMSIVEGMRGLVEEMKRDASGARSFALPAKKQSLDLSFGSLEAARGGFDAAAKELESRLGPMTADVTRAEESAGRLREALSGSAVRVDVRPSPGDEQAPIAEFKSAMDNARREAATMRKTDADLLTAANSLREQSTILVFPKPAPQPTSTVQPVPGFPGTTEGRPGAQVTSTPQPGVAPSTEPTPSRPVTRPTAAPAAPTVGQLAVSSRFSSLASQIPSQVGQPIESEKTDPRTGDMLQLTTGGVLVWKRSTNWVYFTDGFATWVMGPNGLEFRHNDELLDWEKAPRQ